MQQEVGRVIKVSGPLIVAEGMRNCKMFDVVRVGEENLIGEIIELRDDKASIQVYEETSGLGTGAKVISTGAPLSVELGPGIIEGIYDGIQRPLQKLVEMTGERIGRGVEISAIDHKKLWNFKAKKSKGDSVVAGDILGVVQELSLIHICLNTLHTIAVGFSSAGYRYYCRISLGLIFCEQRVHLLR